MKNKKIDVDSLLRKALKSSEMPDAEVKSLRRYAPPPFSKGGKGQNIRPEIEDIYEIEEMNVMEEKVPRKVKIWQVAAVVACTCVVFFVVALSTGYLGFNHQGTDVPPLQEGELIPPTPTPDWWEVDYEDWTEEIHAQWFEYYKETVTPDALYVDETQTGDIVIYMPPFSMGMEILVNTYRRMYPNVNVIVETPSTTDWDAYGIQLAVELAAGRGPDVIFPHFMYESDIGKMIQAGAFLDLNEFIGHDEGFNFDNYVIEVLDSGIYNGKRYVIPYSYDALVYTASTRTLDEIGFDRSQTGDIVSFINEAVRCLPRAQANPNFRTMFNNQLWNHLRHFSGIELVDYETNTVLPDEDGLRIFLEAYKPYHHICFDHSRFLRSITAEQLIEGAVIFHSHTIPGGFFETASQLKHQDDLEMFVIPGIDGKRHAKPWFDAAIRSGSPNAQNAWNFIKLLLSSEIQENINIMSVWTPVHKGAIIHMLDDMRNYYDGTEIPSDNGPIICARLSDAEVQAYLEAIINIDSCTLSSIQVSRMLNEHMTPFLQDRVSWETAINGLRNQLRLYVSE
jgi:ABC-type glycerol-3-phosphate transport system substrate-binding protein